MNSNVAKVDGLFRQVTPLFLLGLLAMVLLEPMAPAWLTDTLGEDVVLKFVVAFLVLYVLLLWGEALRLQGLLTGLLEAFRAFDRERAGGGAAAGKGAGNPQARREAAKLLIAAMGSDDPDIVKTSHHNLVKLAGQDLGEDLDAWRQWLSSQES